MPRPVTDADFLHIAFQGAGRVQSELGGALNAVHVRRLRRKLDQFAAIGHDQQAVIGLQVAADLAKRRQFVGRVEKQKLPILGILHGRNQRWIAHAIGQLDGKYHVVEAVGISRRFGSDSASFGIDHDIVRIHSYLMQHRGHQESLCPCSRRSGGQTPPPPDAAASRQHPTRSPRNEYRPAQTGPGPASYPEASVAEAVSVVTICLISGEASRRPLVRFRYQLPICCQVLNPFAPAPPGGKKDTTICPATP